jgi:membrane-bound ClpP family serine protease
MPLKSPLLSALGVGMAFSLVMPLWAAEKDSPRKVNEKRLAYAGEIRTLNGKPFSGVAFAEGDNWRAEMTYKDGILDGEVVVVANNRLLSRFRYDKGRKIPAAD